MNLQIFWAGDFAPVDRFEKLVADKKEGVFGELLEEIQKSDIAFFNLESPVSTIEKKSEKSGPNIKIGPSSLERISKSGFNLAGLANNHIMDFGEKGLKETIDTLDKEGFQHVGAGKNLEESKEPKILERKDLRIAFIAVAEREFNIATEHRGGAAPLDLIDNVHQIEAAKARADLVFVTIHGGIEYFPYPRPGLRKACKFLIDRGADGVICHHPQVVGTYEFFQGKPIFYSLGNLIFDHPKPPPGWNSGIGLQLSYDTKSKEFLDYKIIPIHQSVAHQGVRRLRGEEEKNFLQDIEEKRKVLGSDSQYMEIWEQFCQTKSDEILARHFIPFHFKRLERIASVLNLRRMIFSPKQTINKKLNMVRCESHRELLQRILEKESAQ